MNENTGFCPPGTYFPVPGRSGRSASAARGLQGMQLHHRLTRSRLVLLLQHWQPATGEQARPDVPERLGQWLSAVGAIRLNGALHSIESYSAQALSPGGAVDVRAMEDALVRVQAELTGLIAPRTQSAPVPARGRGGKAAASVIDPLAEADFATHCQRYLGLQKQMETRLGTVREQMRQWLAQGSPTLRKLAALDAVMEQMLAVREQKLWAQLPGCLEGRLVHWRGLHGQRLEASGQQDDPQQWRQPGGWLDAFEQDVRALWMAEMQVRLQPIMGLLEAARNENR